MKSIARTGQHDAAARSVVLSSDREIEQVFVFRVSPSENRGPACICPQRILVILGPGHEIVAAGEADAAAFIQPVPSPVVESSAMHFQHRHGVRKLALLPLLRVGKYVSRCGELEVRYRLGMFLRENNSCHGKNEKRHCCQNSDLMNRAEHVGSSSKFECTISGLPSLY